MLERCYSEEYHKKEPSYIGVTCCEEWLNYSNFKLWYDENYYEIENQSTHLDKDILHKGNKIYSPKNCVFAPSSINTMFTKNDVNRGDNLIGVYFCKKYKYTKPFKVTINTSHGRKYLGCYKTEIEAFDAYKQFKESYIKQVADKYKDKIPKKLYEAMYKYKVEITD